MTVLLPSSRTLFTLLTAFSPYSSARCLAFFTDLPRNFLNWVLIRDKGQKKVEILYFIKRQKLAENQFQLQEVTNPYVFCFSFPPSVSARGAWDLSSSSDCAASFLRGTNKIGQLPLEHICFHMIRLKKKKSYSKWKNVANVHVQTFKEKNTASTCPEQHA